MLAKISRLALRAFSASERLLRTKAEAAKARDFRGKSTSYGTSDNSSVREIIASVKRVDYSESSYRPVHPFWNPVYLILVVLLRANKEVRMWAGRIIGLRRKINVRKKWGPAPRN